MPAQKTCLVEAPSDVPEGYLFDATVDGITVSSQTCACKLCFSDVFTNHVNWWRFLNAGEIAEPVILTLVNIVCCHSTS